MRCAGSTPNAWCTPFTDGHHAAQQHLLGLIWWFYAGLKAYRQEPTAKRRAELRATA